MTTADDANSTPSGIPQLLARAKRRWHWLALGLLIGLAIGYFGYATRSPVYQSSAQVLVVKKRGEIGGSDSRTSVVDDYVQTQVTLLRSERILLAAAKRIDATRLSATIADDEKSRANQLKFSLGVARERDPSSGAGGTNVLALTYNGANPTDCRYLLEAVIQTYQKELSTLYDTATKEKLDQFTALLKQLESDVSKFENNRVETEANLRKETPEDLTQIRSRISRETEAVRALTLDRIGYETDLALIRETPDDRASRLLTLSKIGEQIRGSGLARPDSENTEAAIRKLRLDRTELFKKYNVDHPIIQSIDAQIAFLTSESVKSNPRNAEGDIDQLGQLKLFLENRLSQISQKLKQTTDSLNTDQLILGKAGGLAADLENWQFQIADRRKRMDELQVQKSQIEVTRDAGGFEATVITEPNVNPTPIAPRFSQSMLGGIAVGVLLGLFFAALAELADQSFHTPAEIRQRLGLPIIGHVPTIRTQLASDTGLELDPSLVVALRPKSGEAEAYRGIRTALYFSTSGRGHQVIQVTSPNQGDGKSTLAANLAITIAQSGKRVILVDCDFRRPRVDRLFRLGERLDGLAPAIAEGRDVMSAVLSSPIEHLSLLPSGTKPPNPAELLTSPGFVTVIDRLRSQFDFVILDTPPVLAVSDPAAVATRADGVILVFRMTNRARPAAVRAREELGQLGANLLGVVINGIGRSGDGYGNYGGYKADYHQYSDDYTD